jgi:tRNA 2-thiouridine synthesizing protein C
VLRKKLLFVLRRPPQAGFRVRETLDLILTAAAFDQSVSLLFLDDGVYQLKRGQHPEVVGLPPVVPMLEALDLYDVHEVLAERESLTERGLAADDLAIPARAIARSAVAGLVAAHDQVIGC